jgi:uncharacterized protein DUF4136
MRIIILSLLLATLSACLSGVKSFYVVDENKIQSDTFSFYAKKETRRNVHQIKLDSLVESIIIESLTHKNFNQNYPSELYVSYYFKSGKNKTPNNTPYYYDPYYNHSSGVNNVRPEKGILLIEFWDSKDKLLWQGSKTFNSSKSKDPTKLIQEYTREVIAGFKPNL